MATGRMTLEQLVAQLDLGRVSDDVALDATLKPTLAPRLRRSVPTTETEAEPPAEEDPKSLPPPPEDERTSDTLRVKGPLAEGGMGRIDLAEQIRLRRDVALKTLRDEFLEPAFAERLTREGRILGLVEHPNVVPLYGLWTDERNAPVLVMKRIEGVPWRQLIKNPSHPAFPNDADDRLAWHLQVLMRVCDAVHYAHSKGILHLDLKPDNVMVGAFREIYLVDWGVAVCTDPKHRHWLPMADEVQEVLGTPAYLAPEMVDVARRALSPRTDVYLLGATLHEILVGRPPNRGDTLQAMLYAAYDAQAPVLPSTLPPELASICRKAMAPEPADRYPTAEALREALRQFLRHRSAASLAREAQRALRELRELVMETTSQAVLTGQHRISEGSDERNARTQRVFGRCRFGFAESLRQWPDNTEAAEGLQEALVLMAKYHLRRGEAASAETLLQELAYPASADTTGEGAVDESDEIVALRTEALRQRQEAARLERLGLELRRDPGRKARGKVVIFGALFVALPVVGAWVLGKAGVYDYAWWHTLIFDLALAAFFGLGSFFQPKSIRGSARARSMALSLVFIALLATLMRMLSLAMGLWDLRSTSIELFFFGSGSVLAGLLADRRFYLAVPGLFLGAILVTLFPKEAQLWIGLGALLGALPLGWSWIRSG
ncbi:MAG: serine/threonine protein kinase [Sandaracinus sp.]|nr:serine/threonine protein kinase [Sandaracinus sp.]MCB9624148.1 serine/threonine protein kinase [Sandaracinus sp.]MCB9636525.1 serine/threonine protein kinase [Sandaracinus sp.]